MAYTNRWLSSSKIIKRQSAVSKEYRSESLDIGVAAGNVHTVSLFSLIHSLSEPVILCLMFRH